MMNYWIIERSWIFKGCLRVRPCRQLHIILRYCSEMSKGKLFFLFLLLKTKMPSSEMENVKVFFSIFECKVACDIVSSWKIRHFIHGLFWLSKNIPPHIICVILNNHSDDSNLSQLYHIACIQCFPSLHPDPRTECADYMEKWVSLEHSSLNKHIYKDAETRREEHRKRLNKVNGSPVNMLVNRVGNQEHGNNNV